MKAGGDDPWHIDDFTLQKPSGEIITGRPATWTALLAMYAPFAAHFHEPKWLVIYETATGYVLIGEVDMYADFAAPGDRKKGLVDLDRRDWKFRGPGCF